MRVVVAVPGGDVLDLELFLVGKQELLDRIDEVVFDLDVVIVLGKLVLDSQILQVLRFRRVVGNLPHLCERSAQQSPAPARKPTTNGCRTDQPTVFMYASRSRCLRVVSADERDVLRRKKLGRPPAESASAR